MLKFFRLPFATTGDKTAVPDAVDSNGNVSYSQGYSFDYQRQKTDPAAKNIERDKMNQVFFDMTTAIAELQSQGVPDFITTALNGGTVYSYAQYAVVKYSGDLYISLVAANTALPSDATKWALLPTPARIQAAFSSSAVAGGTANAITAAFTPAIAALPAAPGTLSVFARAGSANTTTTPTFAADATAAKTIVKGNNLPLVPGDIAGAGHWLELQYDATLDKWVLQNPAKGVARGIFGLEVAAGATATLTNLDAGKTFIGGSGSAFTLTLPLTSACQLGDRITFANFHSGVMTVQRQGSDNLNDGQSNTAIALGIGGRMTVECNPGGQWYVVEMSGLGVDQVWSNVGGSRTFATTYTNTTGKPIFVSVAGSVPASGSMYANVLGSTVQSAGGGTSTTSQGTLSFIVPPGATYSVTEVGGVGLSGWFELRI